MPIWIYDISPMKAALTMAAFIEAVSLGGLFLVRRFVLPRLRYGEGVNDAVSGTVQAIGHRDSFHSRRRGPAAPAWRSWQGRTAAP